MSGTRGGIGRIVAMGIGLALALVLLVAAEARAGRYAVAQCGWYVGADADWADTTGGAKFRPDGYCAAPPADPFDGSHLKSLTREGQGTVTGTRYARWRWSAPAGTGITAVRGTWWHALHDGIEQRLGPIDWGGGFSPALAAAATETAPMEFTLGFPIAIAAFEDRLLCARGESNWCSLDAPSWSGLRALTITLRDDWAPTAAVVGGDAGAPGWHRGTQALVFAGSDLGAGIRFAETSLDGTRVVQSEYPCAKALIGSEWRATLMRPCPLEAGVTHWIPTQSYSDGPHTLVSCHADFSGNVGCAPARTLLIDNNPPAHPRSPTLVGGDAWRRSNDFDLTWTNPSQAPASPIVGAGWRLSGPLGFDTGVKWAPGRDLAALSSLTVPGAGLYTLRLWLRDEAGNEAPAAAAEIPLRFDDVPPTVAFSNGDEASPQQLTATVADPLAGAASGTISYRAAESQRWIELPTKLGRSDGDGRWSLVAPVPDLQPGTYVFRADAADAAGNTATTTLRADGTQMAVRKSAPAQASRGKARLFARLRGGRGDGQAVTVGFGDAATLSGRLTRVDGAGLAGRELRVASRPSRGALLAPSTETVRTGERGGFELRLPPGPSRRLAVVFAGDGGLETTSRHALELRVRSGISLRATPTRLKTGQVVRLSGRIRDRGAPIPRRGKLVAIQYLEAETAHWRPVLVTRSDHDGRFHARYRFRYITDPATIRLRATALAEERWPYAPGSSSPVTVEVGDR